MKETTELKEAALKEMIRMRDQLAAEGRTSFDDAETTRFNQLCRVCDQENAKLRRKARQDAGLDTRELAFIDASDEQQSFDGEDRINRLRSLQLKTNYYRPELRRNSFHELLHRLDSVRPDVLPGTLEWLQNDLDHAAQLCESNRRYNVARAPSF